MTARAPEPRLPLVLRPVWARRVIRPVQVLILAAFLGGAVVLPADWTPLDRLALAGTGLAIAWFLHRLAGVRLVAEESGITVVNILRSRRLEWAQVLGVRLTPAAPWLVLDVSDGTELAVMGVQGSDGQHARRQAEALARLVVERTATERDD